MILSATLRLRDSFTNVMQRIRRSTDDQTESMRRNQRNTSGVQRSLTSLNAQLRVHQSELRESMHRLDGNANSLQGLRTRSESYTRQLNVHNQRVQQLTRRHREMVAAHGAESTQATRAAAALARARAQQASMERQVRQTTRQIREQSTAMGRLRRDFDDMRSQSMPANRFEAMRGAGTAVTGAGVAGAAGLGLMVKTAADFESAMSRVGALSGATDIEMQKMTQTAQQLGATTAFSATQAAEGMQFLAMSGFNTNETIAAMPGMLDMAAAAQIELGQAADISSNILSAFGFEAGEMGRVGDILTKTFTSSNTDLEMLGNTMKYVGPIAKSAGFSLEEMSASAGLLGNAGIQGEQAGTVLRSTILRLANPPKDAATALDKLGVSITDANGKMLPMADILEQAQKGMEGMTDAQKTTMAANIAGTEAASGFLALLDAGPASLRQFTSELENAGGTAKEVAEKQLDNLNGSLTMLKSASEGVGIAIGETLSPYIRSAAEFLQGLADKFNNLSPEMKKTIAIAAAVATGFALIGGPLLLLIGFLPMIAAGFSMLGIASIAALGPIALAIAGVAAAGYLLYKNWDKIKAFGLKLWAGLMEQIEPFVPYIQNIFNAISAILRTGLTIAQGIVETMLVPIKAIFTGVWGVVKNTVITAVQVIIGVLGGIMQALSGIIDFVVGVFTGDWGKAWQGVQDIFGGILNGLKAIAKGAINAVIGIINSGIAGINTIKAPDWVPGIGGKSPNIPLIPKLATGLPYVPYDNYLALLHKGESVLTRVEADQYREQQTSPKETITTIQKIRQQLMPTDILKPRDMLQTIVQKLTPVNIPSPEELVQKIKQQLIPATIPKPHDILQTLKQQLVSVETPNPADLLQTIKQQLIPATIPKPHDILQTLKQQLVSVETPNPADLLQTIKQQLIPANAQKPSDLIQTIRQKLLPTKMPTTFDTYQNIYQKLIQPKHGGYETLLNTVSETKPETKTKNEGNKLTIKKLAETIVVREEADIDKITDKLEQKLLRVAANMGGV